MTTKIPAELSSTPSIVDNGDATAITIDSSENVGFSITPESHYSDYTNLDFGKTGLLLSASSGTNITSLLNNAYLNSSTTWKYKEADEASKYDQTGGTHLWFTAPTGGSADADLTWTQRLRVDSDGLKFGSDTAAANALDDYEEGTFSGTTDGSAYSGTYTKIGRICHVSFESDNSSSTGTSIAVMPFSAKAGTPVNGSQPTFNTSNTNDNVYVAIYNGGSTAYIYSRTGSTQSVTTGSISVNFVYETD